MFAFAAGCKYRHCPVQGTEHRTWPIKITARLQTVQLGDVTPGLEGGEGGPCGSEICCLRASRIRTRQSRKRLKK